MAQVGEPPPPNRIVKKKITRLMLEKDRFTVMRAVAQVHDIITRLSMLVKAAYLYTFETEGKGPELTLEYLQIALQVVKGGEVLHKRSNKLKERDRYEDDHFELMCDIFDDHFNDFTCYTPPVSKPTQDNSKVPSAEEIAAAVWSDKLSINFILQYNLKQLLTNYNNNVIAHYPKYVKRYVLQKLMELQDLQKYNKATGSAAWSITSHLLYKTPLTSYVIETFTADVVEGFTWMCVPRDEEQYLDEHIEDNVNLYLDKMIQINRELEFFDTCKLFSPICLVSTFIPNHIRIDTNCLTQLLMTPERIEEFVKEYKDTKGLTLKMKSKKDLGTAYSTLIGRDTTKEEDAKYALEIWKFLCPGLKNKHFADIMMHDQVGGHNRADNQRWVFDNTILTDGFSVSLQTTPIQHFKRKQFGKNKKKKKSGVQEFPHIDDPDMAGELALKIDKTRFLGGDAGKKDLLYLTDGFRHAVYTSTQRNKDTLRASRKQQTDRLRRSQRFGATIGEHQVTPEMMETIELANTCKKSCHFDTFMEYVSMREMRAKELSTMYSHPIFRQHKFLTYCLQSSSEERFINKIKTTFSKPAQYSSLRKNRKGKHRRWTRNRKDPVLGFIQQNYEQVIEPNNLMIMYGDWGRNPNLKNSPPTPGVGLRRVIHKKIPTVTMPEAYTSKGCPCCKTRTMENPTLERCEYRKDKSYKNPFSKEKHQLLRCTNVECKSRWW
jgi:hypothetical protein